VLQHYQYASLCTQTPRFDGSADACHHCCIILKENSEWATHINSSETWECAEDNLQFTNFFCVVCTIAQQMHLFLIHWCPLGETNQQNPRVCRRQCSIHKFLPCWIYHYTANGSLHIHWCLHGRTTQQNTRVCRTHPSIHQFLLRYIYHCSAKGPSLLLWGTRPLLLSWWVLWNTQKLALVRAR